MPAVTSVCGTYTSLPLSPYLSAPRPSSSSSPLTSPGLQGSKGDSEDLHGRLRQTETQAEELAEQLRTATSSKEQYRAMAQSLEESMDKERQVRTPPCPLTT